jgi:hypothetical protein
VVVGSSSDAMAAGVLALTMGVASEMEPGLPISMEPKKMPTSKKMTLPAAIAQVGN